MELPLKIHNGKPDKPGVILIHGLGMNNYFWVDPEKCFVLGGLVPLTVFLAEATGKTENTISFGSADPGVHGLWTRLEQGGYSLASWSQRQPLGPIRLAVEELDIVLKQVRDKWPDKPLYLVGHSRGGLIARHYLRKKETDGIEGLVTICSPHSGTGMAKFSKYLKPVGIFLEKIIPNNSRTQLAQALGRISTFFQSPAIEELTPDAEFIRSMTEPLPKRVRRLSFGGTSPSLFQFSVRLPGNNYKIIKFPDMLSRAVPSERLPLELTPGFGDALVSAKSSRLAGARHYDFPDNHVRAAYDREVHDIIVDFLT